MTIVLFQKCLHTEKRVWHWPGILFHCLSCEWEVIVQGDEGPVGGVAQGLGCHGVTVSHKEREEEEVV